LDKAPDAFRTISEVADELDVPQHVLRFWESRFTQIRPMKRAGGRRYYRPDDVDLLRGIRHLLYGEGYTIRGVQSILADKGVKSVQAVWRRGAEQLAPEPAAPAVERLAPDEAARTMFGLLKSPERPQPQFQPEASEQERQEPQAGDIMVAARVAEPEIATRPELSPEKMQRLRNALHELGECRRMIDEAIRSDAA
jgi:DNA-binding transcriptional MerR regulator